MLFKIINLDEIRIYIFVSGVIEVLKLIHKVKQVWNNKKSIKIFGLAVYFFRGDVFIEKGQTYVQLRELCEQININVEWVDPRYHMSPVPGGNLPSGINLTNPTFIYTKKVTKYNDTDKKIMGVDITGVYKKYKYENSDYKYVFDEGNLIIRNEEKKKG